MIVGDSRMRSSMISRMSRLSEGPSGAVPQSSNTSTRILDSLLGILGYDPSPWAMVSSDSGGGPQPTSRKYRLEHSRNLANVSEYLLSKVS
jgi:hypothetical protein